MRRGESSKSHATPDVFYNDTIPFYTADQARGPNGAQLSQGGQLPLIEFASGLVLLFL